jgi:hypothetical protein
MDIPVMGDMDTLSKRNIYSFSKNLGVDEGKR